MPKPMLMMTCIPGRTGWFHILCDWFRGALRRDIQAGNQVGESFWSMLLAEHDLDDAGVRWVPVSGVNRAQHVM